MNKVLSFILLVVFLGLPAYALGAMSLVAHWTLNEDDYDGDYVDTVGSYIARPTGEPNFTTGVRDEQKGAVIITLSTGWGQSETFAFDPTAGMTVCLWVNWNGDWQTPVTSGDLVVESGDSMFGVGYGIKADQRWQHVCVTYDGSMGRVYLNGQLKSYEVWELPSAGEAAIEIGNTNGQQILNGAIDDIRLYNYALSPEEIVQLVTGNTNCTLEYASQCDVSGPYGVPDCIVNMYDLAEFFDHWLSSGLYPSSP